MFLNKGFFNVVYYIKTTLINIDTTLMEIKPIQVFKNENHS